MNVYLMYWSGSMTVQINVYKRGPEHVYIDTFDILLPDKYTCLLEEKYIQTFPQNAYELWQDFKTIICHEFQVRYNDIADKSYIPMETIFINNYKTMEYMQTMIEKYCII